MNVILMVMALHFIEITSFNFVSQAIIQHGYVIEPGCQCYCVICLCVCVKLDERRCDFNLEQFREFISTDKEGSEAIASTIYKNLYLFIENWWSIKSNIKAQIVILQPMDQKSLAFETTWKGQFDWFSYFR